MKEVFLGEVIRHRRLELGLTQEELCEGICEPMTISRLENGRQTPSRNRIKSLLQRLDLPDDRFFGLLSAKEMQIRNLEDEITRCHARFERASNEEKWKIRVEIINFHRQLESVMDKDDTFSKQIILCSTYLLGTENGPYGYEEGMTILLNAMLLTSPKFDLNRIDRGPYTENEIKLIANMALCCSQAKRHYEAINILRSLLYYLQAHWQISPSVHAFIPMVAFSYASELKVVGQHDEAASLADYARNVCINYGYYSILPDLLHILAEFHYHRGNRVESEDFYRQSYYLYKSVADEQKCAIIQAEAKNFWGLSLD